MNSAKSFLEAAIKAFILKTGETPVDEDFSLMFDAAIQYELANPDAGIVVAGRAGRTFV